MGRFTTTVPWLVSIIAMVMALGRGQVAHATIIEPIPIDKLIDTADFIGIVECTKSGIITAEYRVISAYKGPPAGTLINVRHAVNAHGGVYPADRRKNIKLFIAFKSEPTQYMSFGGWLDAPCWWRPIPADYHLPLWQGVEYPSTKLVDAANAVGRSDQAKRDRLVRVFWEATLMNTYIRKRGAPFGCKEKIDQMGESFSELFERLNRTFEDSQGGEKYIDAVLQNAADPRWSQFIYSTLLDCGGKVTLERLEKLQQTPGKLPDPFHEGVAAGIERRLKAQQDAKEKREAEARVAATQSATGASAALVEKRRAASTPEQLEKYRRTLMKGPERDTRDTFNAAFARLCEEDPGAVVSFLVGYEAPSWEKVSWPKYDCYAMASYFGWRCTKDRQKHLTALLKAKEPIIRVAAAVYLCFEDEAAGVAELKKQTALPGLPGIWAAITLVRRGHSDAMPKAIEVYLEVRFPSRDEMLDDNLLRGYLRSSLSMVIVDSISELKLPNPGFPSGDIPPKLDLGEDEPDNKKHDEILAWWKKHGEQVKLVDPWMKTLEKLKID